MAPFRTIANERWRPGYVPASSQELCRRLGILDFREAVSMQRVRLAVRLVNASSSLMAPAVRCGSGLEGGAVLRH